MNIDGLHTSVTSLYDDDDEASGVLTDEIPAPKDTDKEAQDIHKQGGNTDPAKVQEGLKDDNETALTEDIDSLLYTTELRSAPFFYTVFCIYFKWFSIVLVLVDNANSRNGDNPLNIPPGVTWVQSDKPLPCCSRWRSRTIY